MAQYYDNCYYEKIGNSEQVKLEDLPFDIPDSWTWIKLRSFSDIYNGNSINEEEKRKKYTGIPGRDFIATKDVTFDRTIVYNNGVNIPYDSTFKIAPASKILLCIEGGSAGRKIAITDRDVCFGNKLACFNTICINDLYLFNILQSNEFLEIFRASLTGIIGGVSINTLKDFIIPLPPITEQQRIVNKINSFEPLIKQYEDAESKLSTFEVEFPEKLKKAILQYAIEGKLVKQDPNDEPASVLLERIKAEKEKLIKEGKIKQDKNESYIYQGDDKNYYGNIVNKWVVSRLVDVGFITGGGTPKTEINNYWDGNIVWITPADLAKKSKIISDSKRKITNLGLSKSSATIINKNSIIMSSRAPIGYISINAIDLCTSQGCKSFTRYSQNILNIEYVYYYLNAIVEELQKRGSGTIFKEISGKEFGLTPIIIPPLNEQLRIVNKIELINQVID